jgi:asparagine synthase (glutamine-hydrolysing)
MCGILGTVNRPFGEATLDLIRHRGPDDSAISQVPVGGHLLTLGHRRLSIVDLSPAGRQPMWTPQGRYAIVFNGEIYNHLELRSQNRPAEYRGHSDTETILTYLAQHGIASLKHFNGIFSFAFLDADHQKLFLARDQFGVKPLYYSGDDRSFLFSSELRPLLEVVDDSLDPANLAELLRLRYVPSPDTLFKNIRKVRPGHLIEVDLGGPQLSFCEYPWVAPPAHDSPVPNRAQALERYGLLVEQAVQRQLMSDVPIGILLSGGVDSALIASIAQRHSDYRMKAFTVGYTGHEKSDEIAEAQETAKILGLDHHIVRIGLPDFLDTLPRISAILEEPLATDSVVPMHYLSALASGHVKVVLSGQGADEAMGGYRRYQAEVWRNFVPPRVLPPWALAWMRTGVRLMHVRNDAISRGLDSIGEPDDVRRFEAIYAVFGTAQIARLIGQHSGRASERIRYFFELLECSRQRTSAQRLMSLDLRLNLADDLLLYTDKITMRHSIECRVPFLDLDLVRFVESLPCSYHLGILRGKLLHKRFAKRMLPAAVVHRKKNGFLTPTGSWWKSTNLIRDILLDPASRFSTYFDLAEVRAILDEHAAGLNRERHIFLLLSVYYWMEEYLGRGRSAHYNATAVHV